MKTRSLPFLKKTAIFFLLAGLAAAITLSFRPHPAAVQVPRPVSAHIPQSEKTAFGDALGKSVARNKGKSGIRIFETGVQSLNARLALIRLAGKTIDLQYYAVESDSSSGLLIEALIRAAQRGVRVRFLVDGFTSGSMEEPLLALDGMRNIEIRIFNPISTNDESLVAKTVGFFSDLPQNNRRMHNKALIADNQFAIMGGRNLSDEYFEADSDVDFKDIDVLTAGPVTDQLSDSFDWYWNDRNAVPIAAVFHSSKTRTFISSLRQKLHDNWDREMQNPEHRKVLGSTLPQALSEDRMKLTWAEARLAVDDPEKIEKPEELSESRPLGEILKLVQDAHRQFLIISAYFVPEEAGVKWLSGLRMRGVDISVLTNSLASTDVVAVQSGYSPYRKELLENKINLYEIMPMDRKRPKQRFLARRQPPTARLHSKAYVIDGVDTVIGSFNLDPRSVQLNTEMALIVHSPEIAAQMQDLFRRQTDPHNSYRLTLTGDGDIEWNGIEKNKMVTYTSDPHSGLWRKFQNAVFMLLPVEDDL